MLTVAVAENLSPAHPLRRFLKPHTFGTVSINLGASTYLCEPRGLLHRAVALTWDSLVAGFQYSFRAQRYTPLMDHLKQRGVDTLPEDLYPWGADLTAFIGIVQVYVQDYVDVYWPTDAAVFADADLLRFWDALHVLPDSHVPPLAGRDTLVDVVANFIVHVTGAHNSLGNVVEYLSDPVHGAASKVQAGSEVADVQASMQVCVCVC